MGFKAANIIQLGFGADFGKAVETRPMFGGMHQPGANAPPPQPSIDEPGLDMGDGPFM